MRLAVALSLMLSFTASHVRAQDETPRPRGPWADLLTPPRDDVTRRDARRLVRQGLFFLLVSIGPRGSFDDAPSVQLDRALLRFERARRLLPDDVDLAYYEAVALDRWERLGSDGSVERRADEALAAFERVRELNPDYAPARVAFALASLHARRLELEEAIAEYEAALAADIPETALLMGRTYAPHEFEVRLATLYFSIDEGTIHNNLAENLMLLGRLDEAILHYERAGRGTLSPMSRALTSWGLALARHRAGEADTALAAAADAFMADPLAGDPHHVALQERWGALAVLHHPDVFFEPLYEIHAYHAIGFEAYAGTYARWRRAGLEAALTSWRRFLAEGGVSSRYAPHARAQITRLERELETIPAAPSTSTTVGDSSWVQTTNEPWLGRP